MNVLPLSQWTTDYWVQQAQSAKAEFPGSFMPVIQLPYADFAEAVGTTQPMPEFPRYFGTPGVLPIQDAFRQCEFSILAVRDVYHEMTLYLDGEAGYTQEESIHDAYIEGERNVFLVELTHPWDNDSVIFALEYTDPQDPLVRHIATAKEIETYQNNRRIVQEIINSSGPAVDSADRPPF